MGKPSACDSCILAGVNDTFAPPDGAENAPLLILAESLGKEEALARPNKALVGPSGQFLWRIGRRAGFHREDCRVGNAGAMCRVAPHPNAPDEPPPLAAINHCRVHREPLLSEPHQAILTLGATATREVLRFFGHTFSGSLDAWRGYVIGDGSHPWIIPSYHPAYLLPGKGPGNLKYTGVFLHDLRVAWGAATQGFTRPECSLVVDPPADWFSSWAADCPTDAWLAVDIETPRGNPDLGASDPSWRILRVNLAYSVEQGVTVPYEGNYLPTIRRLLARVPFQVFWNAGFDVPRLRKAGTPPLDAYDFKDAWHVLQSDMGADDKDERDSSAANTIKGNSLGFVYPFYGQNPPWKHLAEDSPGLYAAYDGVNTLQVAFGIAGDLQTHGQWEVFLRYHHQLDREVLEPATRIGLLVDQEELGRYGSVVEAQQTVVGEALTTLFPEECLPLSLPRVSSPDAVGDAPQPALPLDGSWAHLDASRGPGALLARLEPLPVQTCGVCGAFPVSKTHNCLPKAKKGEPRGKPSIVLELHPVPRYYTRLEFNPDSPDQIRSYLDLKGLKTGKAKGAKTDRQTTNARALDKLAAKGDPFFSLTLERRELSKTLGTYVHGIQKRLGEDGRVHATFLHRPSTMRLSCVNPNLQNVVHGEEVTSVKPWDPAGFRKAIIAAPGCTLVEIDFGAIEAVLTGWFSGDPDYIRLGQASVYAYLTAWAVDPSSIPPKDKLKDVSTKDLKALLKPFKSHCFYPVKKRVVLGANYGLSSFGMVQLYPDLFPTRKSADAELDFYFSLCPLLKKWQNDIRNRAARANFLGGADHPFKYKHWFWDVLAWDSRKKEWRPSNDANRVVAYYPQSTAFGILAEADLRMTDPESPYYIADLYEGESPFRALIHDSNLFEVPEAQESKLIERASAAMTLPILQLPCPPEWGLGEFLSIGVVTKRGRNWGEMEEV